MRVTDPIRQLREALDELRPDLIAEGGDVRLVDLSGRVAHVALVGGFASRCRDKRQILAGIEQRLRLVCPWLDQVQAVCPAPEQRAR